MSAEIRFVLSQFMRLTDGQMDGETDRQTNAHRKTVPAQLQHGKKHLIYNNIML